MYVVKPEVFNNEYNTNDSKKKERNILIINYLNNIIICTILIFSGSKL